MSYKTMISVIVTCYNQGKYLHESLDSLMSQTYDNWECIIVNDGSKDDTERIALEFCQKDKRICYFFQENRGVSSARNFGISKVKGEFIQFLDADDKIHFRKFEYQLGVLKSTPTIDLIYGSSRYFFDGRFDILYPLHPNGAIPCDLTYRDGFQVEMILKGNICTNCSLLMRRSVIDKVKFNEVIYEDWVFNLECALNGFRFHFDNSEYSYSYVRMTESSQMMKHTNQLAKIKEFDSMLLRLVRDYGYKVDAKLVSPISSDYSTKIKGVVRQFIPPIIYEFLAFAKSRFSSLL